MIAQIGNDEIIIVTVPLGYHYLIKKYNIDAHQICRDALIDRIRASVLADNMLIGS